ncbi:hypothetical protein [Noviherbaspirillum sp. UKPF54]|uniref:hypothetical protein n=1 Tax=Noviherbaspirillum sp. UKPF54 TaxID=2601898 RepID=UPI0011B144E8|nr:hypothetical protein [Noviherbaspirillum sp. UKPF54]QDZ29349.1 hypothetical protein FAY22_16110 [Noviherbaspirillum sp. UKPF54]
MIAKFAPCVTVAVASLLATQIAYAGDFNVACSYKNDNLQRCASVIADIVTDKFIAKFPATKYQIFVHSNIMSFTNGGYSAYAIAGVVPKNSGQFPMNRFANTNINGTDKKFSAVELANYELETYRSAVKSLMEQCEISPSCDVYIPRETK